MKRVLLIGILATVFLGTTSFRPKGGDASPIKWYTLAEAQKLSETKPKKIFMDVYTSWCGWCKVMDQKTFSHPVIAAYMNKHFYPVKFDAETRDTVYFNGQKFINDGPPNRGAHQFASTVLQGRLSYPSFVFIDETRTNFTIMQGFQEAKNFEPYLHYYAEDKNKTTSWDDFQKTFKGEVK
ncbi:MAG: SoxW [Bacteroidetes bacterium]|nr:MAG: SoxW [Bacteroidota bacterium]